MLLRYEQCLLIFCKKDGLHGGIAHIFVVSGKILIITSWTEVDELFRLAEARTISKSDLQNSSTFYMTCVRHI